jgi:alkanesulfonate monooxygenase SsuD/methylene tetrahydromethanopterin reductase-like flavin-dependent oxidoreductase (luciferase family)
MDEYEAAGVPWEGRGDRMGEAVQVLKAIWTTDPVEFQGEFYRVPKSIIGPKPIQQPHPPIYMAAYVRPAMQRVAQLADGWFPVGIPLDAVGQMFDGIKGMMQEAGRDPEDLHLIVRANLVISETPLGDDRTDYYGTMEQIEGDFAKTRELGADELIVDVQFSPDVQSTDDILARMETIRGMVD